MKANLVEFGRGPGLPLALAVAGGLLLLPWIGRVPLLDDDEPRYVECSRQMLLTGDWVYPHFNGRPRHHKPAFFYWVQAPVLALLGVSEFSARLPSVLATVGTGLVLFGFTARHRGRAVGAAAMVTWLALPQTHVWAKMTITDAVLTCLLTAALVAAYRGMESPRGGLGWYALSGLMMGCAALTKGPVGIVVPGAVYVLYALLSRSARRGLGQVGPYLALVVALAVSAPWYALQISHYGREYIDAFFGFHNVQRYTKAEDNLGPIGWLWPVPVVLLFAFPLSVLLPRALRDPLRGLREAADGEPVARWRLFLTAWVIANVVLFAPSATRLPHYVMALYPAAAMLLADLLVREAFDSAETVRRSRWIAGALLVTGLLLAGGFGYGALRVGTLAAKVNLDNIPLIAAVAWTLVACFVCAGVVCAVAWLRARRFGLLVPMWAMSLLMAAAMSDLAWPAFGITRDQGLKQLALLCRDRAPLDAPLIGYRLDTSSGVFYARRNVVAVKEGRPGDITRLLSDHPRSFVITYRKHAPELQSLPLRVVAEARQYVLFAPRSIAPAASTATTP